MGGTVTCPRCGGTAWVRCGTRKGDQRWRWGSCRRRWNERWGTPLFQLHPPLPEIGRTIRVVLARGSRRAAEELTGHTDDPIAGGIRRLGAHAEAVTDVLVRDLHLAEVAIDEFWSFGGKKGEAPSRWGQASLRPRRRRGSAGAR
jgi:hypothetical protein